LQRVYGAADLELFPSTMAEGVPLVILEALACGVPVLSAATPALRAIPALQAQPDWFVRESSVDAWVARIIDLTTEPRLTQAKAAARSLAMRFFDQRLTQEQSVRAIRDAVRARGLSSER
jgi:glycosyltransferase involved in cell wall biosynthesis